jgi:8-oxo-dGTP pyrophosphatase MutT (NUDIX family)
MMTIPPRPACTVVVLRPSRERFSVCLVRRQDEVAFMGGAHVFPGGRLHEGDFAEATHKWCDGADVAGRHLPGLPSGEAIAHHVGAVRELFEEAGVLLARRDGAMVALSGRAERARYSDYRAALMSGTISMDCLAAAEQIRFALDALVPFAHWTTPETEHRRYDVRFFLAHVDNSEPLPPSTSRTEVLWADPIDAVERCRRGELLLAPPTWTTLRRLEGFVSIAETMQWAQTSRPGRVQPRLFEDNGQRLLALPGDPLYPPVDGFDTPQDTRFVFTAGRWRPLPDTRDQR